MFSSARCNAIAALIEIEFKIAFFSSSEDSDFILKQDKIFFADSLGDFTSKCLEEPKFLRDSKIFSEKFSFESKTYVFLSISISSAPDSPLMVIILSNSNFFPA